MWDRMEPGIRAAVARGDVIDCETVPEDGEQASEPPASRFRRKPDTEADLARRREAGQRLWKRLLTPPQT